MRAPSPTAPDERCPCRSRLGYTECCGRYLGGGGAPREQPPTAEALMRSRYTANVRGDEQYLRRTWHPETCPADLTPDPELTWVALQIVQTQGGGPADQDGTVHFRASYRTPQGRDVLEEVSTFTRLAGRWVYVTGDVRA